MTAELHICWARKDDEKIHFDKCPTCKRKRRFYAWFQDWYGWYSTCLSCGDQWCDGEMIDRPFKPGWRKENIAEAKAAIKKMRLNEPRH